MYNIPCLNIFSIENNYLFQHSVTELFEKTVIFIGAFVKSADSMKRFYEYIVTKVFPHEDKTNKIGPP